MAFNVRFLFRDSRGRPTSRTYHNTSALIADVFTDVTTLAPLLNAMTDLAMEGIVISVRSTTTTFTGAAVSNVDENVSVKVLAEDGFQYDVDLPDVPDVKTPSEQISLTDTDLVALFGEFETAGKWRINLRNPTAVASVISATLDK